MLWYDLLHTFLFYLVFFFCTCIGLPIALQVNFTKPSTSYVVGKVFGLLIFGYGIWLPGSLRVLDYQSHALILVLFLLCVAGGLSAAVFHLRKLDSATRKHYLRAFLCVEFTSFV